MDMSITEFKYRERWGKIMNNIKDVQEDSLSVPDVKTIDTPQYEFPLKFDAGGNFYKSDDAWNALSIAEKAEMMKVAIRNGITNLKEIRQRYNEYAKGGHDNSFIQKNIPLSAYTPNSDGKTENYFFRYKKQK